MNRPVAFTDKELKLAEKYFKTAHPNSSICLEYGAGGSTICFSKYVRIYYSIEHDYDWYIKVQIEILKRNITNVQLFLVHSNWKPKEWATHDSIEYNGEMGNDLFKEYINFSKNLPLLDFVFIDGRARKHCAFNLVDNLRPDSIIIFHDFMNRWWYQFILRKYTIIESADKLAILKLK